MIPRLTTFTVLLGWLGLVGSAWPQPSGQPPAQAASSQKAGPLTDEEFHLPLDAKTAGEVDRLVPLLNSPTFKEREQASEALTDIGAPAFAKLREAYHASEDLEVRLRVEAIVRTAYLNHHVLDRNGFLGVSLDTVEPRPPKLPKLAESEGGLRIRQVTSNTGAARAGLKADDVILALNGKSLRNQGRNEFSESIRRFPPGTVVRLSVLRDGKALTIDAKLGRCPEEVLQRSSVLFRDDYYEAANRFPDWWYKFFAPAESAPSSQP